ncbi:PAS domain S-box-containing protein [Agrobacterium larrymoorei]|uniref:PAS domain S-box-containing protein n=1 Tax=Agrobacterium larrymoorei TaxID=160699 RepID=A0AAJ2EVA2_9HYPH|nr:PAS domain-containing protein [Agrobacterium larrymoorei]MDR6102342.1 PAS domain S-box-containing protein [Agrobacterium larrymoorei]
MPTSFILPPLREFFNNATVALALAEAKGDNELVLVNQHFKTLTGYEDADVLGKNCRMLQHRADGERALNEEARTKIHSFLSRPTSSVIRTPIVNFRKDGRPFVNLLFMSKLTSSSGDVQYIFASQFDISRTRPDLLDKYNTDLGTTLIRIQPMLEGHNVIIEGSLATIASSATTIAQAKVTLAELDKSDQSHSGETLRN